MMYVLIFWLGGAVAIFSTAWIRDRVRRRRESEDMRRLWNETGPMGDASEITTGRIDASQIITGPST